MNITEAILNHIRKNPGTSRSDLATVLPEGTKMTTISSTCGRLKRAGVIEGRGPSPKLMRWYSTEKPSKAIFMAEAEVILAQLDAMPPAARVPHLARKMQELSTGPEPLF